MSNCKPGDLAVIVKPGTTEQNVGKFVTVIRASHVMGPGWWEAEALSALYKNFGEFGTYGFIEDHRLRPIRPQPDAATDETLLWKPVPSTTKEHA